MATVVKLSNVGKGGNAGTAFCCFLSPPTLGDAEAEDTEFFARVMEVSDVAPLISEGSLTGEDSEVRLGSSLGVSMCVRGGRDAGEFDFAQELDVKEPENKLGRPIALPLFSSFTAGPLLLLCGVPKGGDTDDTREEVLFGEE